MIVILGIFFPFGNSRGTIIGALLALLVAHFISIGCFINGPKQDPIPWISFSNAGTRNRGDEICVNYSTGINPGNWQNDNRYDQRHRLRMVNKGVYSKIN